MNLTLGEHPDCVHDDECAAFAAKNHQQLSTGQYDWPVSILQLDDIDAYLAEHRTARKRAQHARNLGYRSGLTERADHIDDIYAINTSAPVRQGRPMSDGYLVRTEFTPLPDYPCPRHRIDTWGVSTAHGRLVAYLVLYVCGEMAMVSQILGHAGYMPDDVMYLLILDAFRGTPKPTVVFYNRHDSGSDGLRYFKTRLGFRPGRVAWLP